MKRLIMISKVIVIMVLLCYGFSLKAQELWPKTLTDATGTSISIFQPQPEQYASGELKFKTVFSINTEKKDNPVFGVFWSIARVSNEQDGQVNLADIHITHVQLAGSGSENYPINKIKPFLSQNIYHLIPSLDLNYINSSVASYEQEKTLSRELNNKVPNILYSSQDAILATIDGNPILKYNQDWKLQAVSNTPFTIVKAQNGLFYLYGSKNWYRAEALAGPFVQIRAVPSELKIVQQWIDGKSKNMDPGYEEDNDSYGDNGSVDVTPKAPKIILVTNKPSELISTDGIPKFKQLSGTPLSYVSNSRNDLFIDNTTGSYYVLFSGRWYEASQLQGPWEFIESTELPVSFKNIQVNSPKGYVLASIAGTRQSEEALLKAQVPAITRVERSDVKSPVVTYDGAPQFESIAGTAMQYAVNTSSSVIAYEGRYYCVDNGVWFVSSDPQGPWELSSERPSGIEKIPPTNPMYNTKYVYIYDAGDDWVDEGFTPGYLNCYIYGPTLVYGTGFYYSPWWGMAYHPRPWTWGFSFFSDPWLFWDNPYYYAWMFDYWWFSYDPLFFNNWCLVPQRRPYNILRTRNSVPSNWSQSSYRFKNNGSLFNNNYQQRSFSNSSSFMRSSGGFRIGGGMAIGRGGRH